MRDMIFISLENWDGIWRRNQYLCAEWLRRFPGMRLLFVGRTRDISHSIKKRDGSAVFQPAVQKCPEFPGLSILNPLKLFPNSLMPGRWFNQQLLLVEIRKAVQRLGLRSPLLWINDHFAAPLVGKLGERAVIYDVTDDWTLMSSIPEPERARIREADVTLCNRADLVVVCSEALERSRKPTCRKLVRVPNGVDAARYGHGGASSHNPAGAVSKTFGYLGTLHSDRLDLGLITTLAERRPQDRVVLCGPNFLTASELLRLKNFSNIELKPARNYQEVPLVLDSFDVCILPHLCTPFTESLNPIKLWEYLASGKPVAATPVAGFREYAHLFHLGTGAEGFFEACEKALLEEGRLVGVRMREAARHSWRSRAEDLLEVFRQEGWMARSPMRRARTQPGTRRTLGRAEMPVSPVNMCPSGGV